MLMFRGARAYGTWWVAALLVTSLASSCGWDWSESYEYDDNDPFDLEVLHELLKARPNGFEVLHDSLPQLSATVGTPANYLFIGSHAYYSNRELTHLLDFVERGNTAFLAVPELPPELAEHLYGTDCFYYADGNYSFDPWAQSNSDEGRIHLAIEGFDTVFTMTSIYNFKPTNFYFNTIDSGYLCDPALDNFSIGAIDSLHINFVELSWGEGKFYFNTLPKLFTNFYVLPDSSNLYAAAALSKLNDGPIYWDEASRIAPVEADRRRRADSDDPYRDYSGGRNFLKGNETLSYVLRKPSLAFAWYLLVAAVLLYVIFRGKRRQRVIPEILRRENSSQRFIDTLSRLVFQKGNHTSLAQQELRSLRTYLNQRYGLRWELTTPLPAQLTELSGAETAVIDRAREAIEYVRVNSNVTEGQLTNFYRAIEPLYQL